jgi:hypothetical protein
MHSNSKDTVLEALAHRAGPVPVDFGGTAVTGIHASVVAALRARLGLPGGPVRVVEPYQMLGEIADDLMDAMGIDCIGAPARCTMFGFPLEGPWREWRCPWGQIVLMPAGFVTSVEEGDVYVYPEGDASVPPSGRMPASGYFFDAVIRQEPLDEETPDPADNLEEFAPLSAADAAYWKRQAAVMRASPRAVVATLGGTAFGDIALVPAPFLKRPKGIRDISEWYMALASRRDYVHAIFARQCEVALANLDRFHGIVGNAVDVLYVCGTDFGTQSSQFCSRETFDELYLPYYRRINDWVHRHTSWKTLKHSCGAIDPLLPSLIQAGFDIINPVQCSATGMHPDHLKQAYGRDLVFWGGGVDTQRTLPFGTPAQVRAEVLERCRVFSRDGGFVFSTIHNIQARTPTENVVAMVEAVRAFNTGG